MEASSIEEVIQYLDVIIKEEISEKSRLAFFPILYKKVTIAIKVGITEGVFDDNELMEKLDRPPNTYSEEARSYHGEIDHVEEADLPVEIVDQSFAVPPMDHDDHRYEE